MPFGSVTLRPGVYSDTTPTLGGAQYQLSQLIRFKDSLAQKFGGWELFYPFTIGGAPRDLHAWSDLNQINHLAIGTTAQIGVVTAGSYQNITPQKFTSDFSPSFTTTSSSKDVEITDPNVSNVTIYDSVFFNTPISVGGIVLSGLYPIILITGTHTYKITAATAATSSVTNGGAVPTFTTTSGSSIVEVHIAAHGMSVGNTIVFPIATTGNGVTILGAYPATAIVDANNFDIQVPSQATATSTFSMNSGNAELVYYIALGPPAAGVGYGLGGYGLGGFGTGVTTPDQTGTPIAASDWTSDNWGELLLACPANGIPYYWDPTGGFANMQPITGAPTFCSGIFVSTSAQILVAYGASIAEQIGVLQDPMLVAWTDSGNFFDWVPTSANLAGNFRIPIGSEIRGGMAGAANQNLIWTDLDVWSMNFIGYPNTYGFNKIGSGAGLIGRHGAQQLRGAVHWMGESNFYQYDGNGVRVVPCPVWDAVFQNINLNFAQNVRAMPNTPFNEAGYFYPSLASVNGECDSYVKYNVLEPGQPWDIGQLPRSAWIDQSVFGSSPIAASPGGQIFQHEMTNDANGQPLVSSFTTGFFMIAEGEDFPFVDQIYPDFIWGTYAGAQGAQIQITFNVVNYPGDTPVQYGPYTVTQSTQFVSTRFRGRQMSITVTSSDIGSFWRLGRIRYRWSPSGRR